MKLTEAKIRQAQEVIEAVMAECELFSVNFHSIYGVMMLPKYSNNIEGDSLADLYINRLHELNGTEPPPF